MPTPLDAWQARLHEHFSALAHIRESSGFPIFALEHGLTDTELEEISAQLHSRLQAGLGLSSHWLLWVTYAAERGYDYSGDEYWRSFEEHTPGWELGDRDKLSGWFKRFQQAYNGVTPSGPWAEHFRIISWPITHAVLPLYLQRHFAKALYDLRYSLARLDSIEPAVIGRMIAANSFHNSRRFDEFLQQEELAGRIVLALLQKDLRKGEEPLLPATLQRIVADLEQVRYARGWLKETSRIFSDRFKGIGRGSGSTGGAPGEWAGSTRAQNTRPDLRPSLFLRYLGNETWTLIIDVPSFNGLAASSSEIREYLRRTRCSLNGGDGKKPAGWVLSGNRRAVLKRWPDPSIPLVNFEQSNGPVDHILANECRLSEGPVSLFRIGNNGIAREIVSRIVRPGGDYIVISKKPIPAPPEFTRPCSVDCEGISALRLCVPGDVTSDFIQWLRTIGVELARTIRVWPAGLSGRNWDGEGRSEWLTTESPCLGIVSDYPVESFLLNLNHSTNRSIRAEKDGRPTFIQLPTLAAGTHLLTVKAQRSTAMAEIINTPANEGFIELRVREPSPWQTATASHAGLIITGDPHDASLEAFWENEYSLSVLGPASRSVVPAVILEDGQGEEIFRGTVCSALDLPVKPEVWRKRFDDFLKRENCRWNYLEASAGSLIIDAQDLGSFSLRFENELRPLRWVLKQVQNKLQVRLVDETDSSDQQPTCIYFPMEEPARGVRLDFEHVTSGIELEAPGGLFLAQCGEHLDSIIASVGLSGEGLGGLGVSPNFSNIQANSAALVRAIQIWPYWRSARVSGFVVGVRQKQVLDGILSSIFGAICGQKWIQAESDFSACRDLRHAIAGLKIHLRSADRYGAFSSVLERDALKHGHKVDAIADWYAEVAARYKVCSASTLSKFAVFLAFQPHLLPRSYRNDLATLIERLITQPDVLRGARFLALICANAPNQPRRMLPDGSS